MTKKDVEVFDKLYIQIRGLHEEISIISKKSPNDALNKFKLKFINQILSDANVILAAKHKPFDDFTIFSEDDMPTNSDAVMVLTQYISCLEKYKFDNIEMLSGYWHWKTKSGEQIKTTRPSSKFTF